MPNEKRFIAIRTGNEEHAYRKDHISCVVVHYRPDQDTVPLVFLDMVGIAEDIQLGEGNVERFLAWYNGQVERLE